MFAGLGLFSDSFLGAKNAINDCIVSNVNYLLFVFDAELIFVQKFFFPICSKFSEFDIFIKCVAFNNEPVNPTDLRRATNRYPP